MSHVKTDVKVCQDMSAKCHMSGQICLSSARKVYKELQIWQSKQRNWESSETIWLWYVKQRYHIRLHSIWIYSLLHFSCKKWKHSKTPRHGLSSEKLEYNHEVSHNFPQINQWFIINNGSKSQTVCWYHWHPHYQIITITMEALALSHLCCPSQRNMH